LVAAAKFLVAATKNSFVVPNFVAETKHFFSVCHGHKHGYCRHFNLETKLGLSFASKMREACQGSYDIVRTLEIIFKVALYI